MKTKEQFIEEIYAKVERAEAAEREKRIKKLKIYRAVSAAAACFIVAFGIYGYSASDAWKGMGLKNADTANISFYSADIADSVEANLTEESCGIVKMPESVDTNVNDEKATEPEADNITRGAVSDKSSEPKDAAKDNDESQPSEPMREDKDSGENESSEPEKPLQSYDITGVSSVTEKSTTASDELADSSEGIDKSKLSLMTIERVKNGEYSYYNISDYGDVKKIEEWIYGLDASKAMGCEKFLEINGETGTKNYCIINITKEQALIDKKYLRDMKNPDRTCINTGEDNGYAILTWYIASVELPKLNTEID